MAEFRSGHEAAAAAAALPGCVARGVWAGQAWCGGVLLTLGAALPHPHPAHTRPARSTSKAGGSGGSTTAAEHPQVLLLLIKQGANGLNLTGTLAACSRPPAPHAPSAARQPSPLVSPAMPTALPASHCRGAACGAGRASARPCSGGAGGGACGSYRAEALHARAQVGWLAAGRAACLMPGARAGAGRATGAPSLPAQLTLLRWRVLALLPLAAPEGRAVPAGLLWKKPSKRMCTACASSALPPWTCRQPQVGGPGQGAAGSRLAQPWFQSLCP